MCGPWGSIVSHISQGLTGHVSVITDWIVKHWLIYKISLCLFVVAVIVVSTHGGFLPFIYLYSSGSTHWYWGNHMIALAKKPRRIWVKCTYAEDFFGVVYDVLMCRLGSRHCGTTVAVKLRYYCCNLKMVQPGTCKITIPAQPKHINTV